MQTRWLAAALLAGLPFSAAGDLSVSAPDGVVVEAVAPGSALASAGLLPGDILLSWTQPANPLSSARRAAGALETPFDWMALEALAKSHEYRSDTRAAERRYREAMEIRVARWREQSLHFARAQHQVASMAWSRGELASPKSGFEAPS